MIRDALSMEGMYKQRLHLFESPHKAWVAGGKGTLQFDGWIEQKLGELNQRTVIKGFTLFALWTGTVATSAFKGENTKRVFRDVTVEQKDKVKRYDAMPGDAIRIANYGFLGARECVEDPDIAVGVGQTALISLYVPLAKPNAYEGDDFAMAAEVLKHVSFKMALDSDLSVGTSAVTTTSIDYWVVAECYEEAEVKLHAVDTLSVTDFESATETKLIVGGKLADLYMYKPATTDAAPGQDSIGGFNTVRVIELHRDAIRVPDLAIMYSRWRGEARNNRATKGTSLYQDPFVNNFNGDDFSGGAIAIIASTGAQISEDPVSDVVHVKLTTQATAFAGAATTPRLIARVIEPTSPKLERSLAKRYGATATKPATAKPGKGVRADVAPFMPKTFLK